MELLPIREISSAIIVSAIIIFLLTVWSHSWDHTLGITRTPIIPIRWTVRSESSPAPGSQERPARALIESIKEVTHQEPGGSETSAAEQTEAWNRQNPCLSRLELITMYDDRKYVHKLQSNPVWDELFSEYSKLHRTCMQKVENLTDYFLTGNVSTGCQFAVADVAPGAGLGNKMLVLVSALLYAILTRRVLLIPSATLVPDWTCEPFVGSSWALDSNAFPVPHFYKKSQFAGSSWTYDKDFFQHIDEEMKQVDQITLEGFEMGRIIPSTPLKHAVGVITNEWQPSNRFYCSSEQTFYSQATWVYLSGYMYTIPKLFATPIFRPTLEDIFPDRMVTTRLLRSVLLPADVVWTRVRRINRAYLDRADRKVGIQARYKDGVEHYRKMNDLVNERITDCAQHYALLPNVISSPTSTSLLGKKAVIVKVFVASLFPGLFGHLSKTYVRYATVTGEDVSLVQISQDKAQVLDSVEEDQQAFTEVLLLSFSDQLLVTPVSTFGGLAQLYGALTPWFIEMREDRQLPSCERGQSVDVCNQFADKAYRCPYDPSVNNRLFNKVVPYIKDCLEIDHPGGIQLATKFHS